MKNLIIFSICLLFSCTQTFSQQNYEKKYKATIQYDPSDHGNDGYKLEIRVLGRFDAFMGGPTEVHTAKAHKVGTEIYLNGKWHSESEFDQKAIDQISIGILNFEFGIYDGNYRVSTKKIHNAISFDTPGSPDWGELFPGVSGPEVKELYRKGYNIRDFRLWDFDRIQNGFYSVKKKLENEENYKTLKSEGQSLELSGDFEGALDTYEKAHRLGLDKDYTSQKIANLKKRIIEGKVEEAYNNAVKSAEEKEAAGDFDGAIEQYKKALSIKPEDDLSSRKVEDLISDKKAYQDNIKKAQKAEKSGDLEEAKGYYEAASKANPSDNKAAHKIVEIEEKLREERLEVWQKEKEKAQAEKERQDAQLMASQVATVSLINVLMFTGLGKDRPRNIYNSKGMNTKVEYGYGVSYTPVFEEQTIEHYDGNSSDNTNKLVDGEVLVLNVKAGLELWPLRTNYFDLGIAGKGQFGMGASSEISYGYDFGGMVDLGFPSFKVIGRYNRGNISASYYSTNVGSSVNISSYGDMNLNYQSYGFGVKASFDSWDSRSNIELLYTQLMPSEESYHIADMVTLSWWTSNRIKLTLDYSWNYPRTSETSIEYSNYDKVDVSYASTYVAFHITRLLDFYKD